MKSIVFVPFLLGILLWTMGNGFAGHFSNTAVQTQDSMQQPLMFRACNRIDAVARFPSVPPVTDVVAQLAGPTPSWPDGELYIAADIRTRTGGIDTDTYKAFGQVSGERHIQGTYPPLNLRALFPSVSAHGNQVAYALEQYPNAGYSTRYLFVKNTGPGFFGEGNEITHIAFAPIGPWTLSAAGAGKNFDLVGTGIIYAVLNTQTFISYYVRQGPGPNSIYEALPSDDEVEFVNLRWPSSNYATENPETSDSKISAYIDVGTRLRIIGPGPDGVLDGGLGDDESFLLGSPGDEYSVDVALTDDAQFIGTIGGSPYSPRPSAYWNVATLLQGPQGRMPSPPVFQRVLPLQAVPQPVAVAIDIDGQWNSAAVAGSMATLYTGTPSTTLSIDYRKTFNTMFLDSDDVTSTLTFPLPTGAQVMPKSVSIKEDRVSFAVSANQMVTLYQATFC